ncbi:MAG: methyltransferase [Betaproteobacteria bacterium]|nr:methyltransferase [Betaproteobacteria bacterium]
MELTRAQVDAAVGALAAVLPLERPADAALRAWFRAHPKLGSRDRGFVADAVFATLRHMRRLEHLTARRDPRGLLLGALVFVLGRQVGALRGVIRDTETGWLAEAKARQADAPPLPDDVRLSLPPWLHARLVATYGPVQANAIGASLLESAPLDLRVNTLLARRDDVIATLRADGFDAQPTPLSPTGIRLRDKGGLERHDVIATGLAEVQDEGSQLVAMLMQARRGQMVVDFCAGAGGKTLALGAAMRSEGRLYAFDTSERRLANLKPRLRRSGLSNVHPQLIASENDTRVKRLAGRIDAVLVDAPCSGTGTLRRNPDLKWRMHPGALEELATKQRAILQAAARLVRPGGRLVYATCSLLPEENENVVSAFLDGTAGWCTRDALAILASQGVTLEHVTPPCLGLLPHLHGTDGFFAAVLEREAS